MFSLKSRRARFSSLSTLKQPLIVPVLLAAALTACTQQADAPKETTQAPAAPAATAAPAPAASQEAVASQEAAAQEPVASAAPAASAASAAVGAYEFPPLTPEGEAVKQRAQERWDALVARDFERAWTYLDSATRKKIEQQNYKKLFGDGGVWSAATVLNAKCITGRCAAFVRLTTQTVAPGFAKGPLDVTNHFDEEWVLEDGQWNYRGLSNGLAKDGEEALPSAAAPRQPQQPLDPSKGAFGGGKRR